MKRYTLISVLLFLFCFTLTAQLRVKLFNAEEVRLLDSPFLQAQQTDLKYILELEPDRLLAPFLREAGLPSKASSYTNWENTGLDGHIGGHYLSALAMMYAATGNIEVKHRLDYMIAALKRCQDETGTGFIGGTPGSIRMWHEIRNGDIKAENFSLNGKWVPLYNIHKTFAGLRDAYNFGKNKTAGEMLIRLTDWMISVTENLTDEKMQYMLGSEHGGLNETFADVYAMTGEKKYLMLAKRFSHMAILSPLLEQNDKLTGLHANTQIPKVVGYKRIADLEGNKAWDDASAFFWNTVVENRTISIGGNSVREHFHPADDFGTMVTDIEGPETCNTYNMLRLSILLYQTSCNTVYLDYYERALYNHILSSQEPEKGGFVYFTPMRPGHYRVYSQPETSMWCCVGSGLENHAKYGEIIYAHTDHDLYVNLFIPSRLSWTEKGTTIRQETRFPDENQVRLRIEESSKKPFMLKIRYPEWAKTPGEFKIAINGKELLKPAIHNGYISTQNRKWSKGDIVTVSFPMALRIEQLPDKNSFYSFAYGPVVLAAKTGTEDLEGLYADDSRGGHIAHGHQIPLQETPMLVGEAAILLPCFKKEGDELRFKYAGEVYPERFSALEFIPFFRLHESRYAVYFRQVTPERLQLLKDEITRQEKVKAELAQRTIDMVYPGEQQPESDHFIKHEDSRTGVRDNRHYRMAKGWFSYDFNVKEEASSLMLVLHKEDHKPETRVYIDAKEVKTSPVTADLDENFICRIYELPEKLHTGTHTVRFLPGEAGQTSRIYEVRILK